MLILSHGIRRQTVLFRRDADYVRIWFMKLKGVISGWAMVEDDDWRGDDQPDDISLLVER
jgi:hypothetical protein